MSEAYESDIVEWSQRQAALLRRRAAGEPINEAELDWPNIAEEIEDLGRSQVQAVESHLLQAMLHELKVRAWPEARDAQHWRGEVRLQRGQAARRYTRSMLQQIDVADLYRLARRALPDSMDGQPPAPLPEACPWSLDELLGEEPHLR